MPTLELPDSTYNELLELSDAVGQDPADLIAELISRGFDGGPLLFQNGTVLDPPPSATSALLSEAIERITSPSPSLPLEVADFGSPGEAEAALTLNWDAIVSLAPNDMLVERCRGLASGHREALAAVYSVLDEADWGSSAAQRLWLRHCQLAGLPAPPTDWAKPTAKTD